MIMKQKNLLLLAGAGALAYYFLVYKKNENGSSAFSNAAGDCKPPLKWCARRNRCISQGANCGIVYDKDGKPIRNY